MTLYDLTKKYGEGKGEEMMWKTVRVISDSVEDEMDEHARHDLIRKVYGAMSDHHYNEDLARQDVAGMFYIDGDGREHPAPYWPEDAVKGIYEDVRANIVGYNFWDFYVTMNMIASDNWCMLKRWFPRHEAAEMNERIAEMAVVWLKDDDWPGKTKIWDYLSSREPAPVG